MLECLMKHKLSLSLAEYIEAIVGVVLSACQIIKYFEILVI